MAELSTRYATALHELAIESGSLIEWVGQAEFVRDIMQTDECKRIIGHPYISYSEKTDFLSRLFSERINSELLSFLYLAISKGRTAFIAPALTEFIKRANLEAGKAEARVVSAVELTEDQISELASLLSKKLSKQVEISLKVDPYLIGGFYVQVEGYLINRSVLKQLEDLKNSVKRGMADDTQAQ